MVLSSLKPVVGIYNRYKVIFHVDNDLVEVFDLHADPMGNNNLIKGMPNPTHFTES